MADVFLSYATEDRTRAKSLAEGLELRGWSVWWDKKIPLGQSFDKVIEDAIGAARCVIVLWSHSSIKSEWVRNEASEGRRQGILVPVFLDPVVAPLAFRLLNGANLSLWQSGIPHPEFDKLTERVAEILAQTRARGSVQAPDDERERAGVDTGRPWRRWLVGGAAILAAAAVLYTGYAIGERRREHVGSEVVAKQSDLEKHPSTSTASDPSGLADALRALGSGAALGGGTLNGAFAMTAFQLPTLGLQIAFLTPGEAQASGLSAGAVVYRLDSGLAQTAGLHVGDVVAAVNGQKIATVDDLRRVLKGIGPGKSKYLIRRGKEMLTVEIDCRTCRVT